MTFYFLTYLLLTKVTNFSSRIENKGLTNEFKNQDIDSSIRYGYDERFFNKNSNITDEINNLEEEELIRISENFKKKEILSTLELINDKIKESRVCHPDTPYLQRNIISDDLKYYLDYLDEMSNSNIWKDLINDFYYDSF